MFYIFYIKINLIFLNNKYGFLLIFSDKYIIIIYSVYLEVKND